MRKILFALLAIALLTLVACMVPQETPKTTEEPTQPETTPELSNEGEKGLGNPEDSQRTQETTTSDNEGAIIYKAEDSTPTALGTTLLSDLVCANNKISAIVANTGEEAWTLNQDLKIYLNAGWDKEPGCDRTTLEPGQSTVCDELDWPVINKPGRKNIVVVKATGASATESVICPE